MKDLIELLSRMDAWANKAQLHWPKFLRVNSNDLNLAGRLISRLIRFVFTIAIVAAFVWIVYLVFTRGPGLTIANPAYQHIIPSLEPTATAVPNRNPWMDEIWLSSVDAQTLRSKENVLNLAFLLHGGARYSTVHSVVFQTGSWKQIKPLGMTTLSVSGTAASFNLNGQDYTLNMYQPFIDGELPSYVYIIDSTGNTWRADVNTMEFVSIETAIKSLPIQINPNPNLSYTY